MSSTFHPQLPIVIELLKINEPLSDDLLNQFFSQPRNQLIADLENLLHHVIDSYTVGQKPNFVAMHTLFLLTELRSKSSLPLLLKLCRQGDAFLESYFEDHIGATMWIDVLVLSDKNIDVLFEVLKTIRGNSEAACILTDGLSQMALHFPELREKIAEGFESVVYYIHTQRKDYVHSHLDWIFSAAEEIEDGLDELPRQILTIRERYNHNATPDFIAETEFQEILAMKPQNEEELKVMTQKVETLYERIGVPIERHQQIKLDIGRNAPCHCGSGKKYKHCCLDK